MIVDKLRLRCSYGAAVFIPLGDRKWTALLAECGEICQHYFSIFETANYADDADNENEQDEGPRIFPALAPALAGTTTKSKRPTKHANNAKETHRYRRYALEFWGAKATCLYSSAVCRRLSGDGLRTHHETSVAGPRRAFGTFRHGESVLWRTAEKSTPVVSVPQKSKELASCLASSRITSF
jgi:hypothetical protein